MASEMRPAKVVGIDPETGDEYPIDTVQWAKDIRNATLDELEKRIPAATGTVLTEKGPYDYYTIGGVEALLRDMRDGK
jgi:hypothetical protein